MLKSLGYDSNSVSLLETQGAKGTHEGYEIWMKIQSENYSGKGNGTPHSLTMTLSTIPQCHSLKPNDDVTHSFQTMACAPLCIPRPVSIKLTLMCLHGISPHTWTCLSVRTLPLPYNIQHNLYSFSAARTGAVIQLKTCL